MQNGWADNPGAADKGSKLLYAYPKCPTISAVLMRTLTGIEAQMRPGMLLGASALFLGSCATYGGYTPVKVFTEIVPPYGFSVSTPVALQIPGGTRFHGAVCRRSPTVMVPPSHLQLDLLDQEGRISASASQRLSGLGGRNSHCAFYDVDTKWTIGPNDRVRVCAQRTEQPCLASNPSAAELTGRTS